MILSGNSLLLGHALAICVAAAMLVAAPIHAQSQQRWQGPAEAYSHGCCQSQTRGATDSGNTTSPNVLVVDHEQMPDHPMDEPCDCGLCACHATGQAMVPGWATSFILPHLAAEHRLPISASAPPSGRLDVPFRPPIV